MTSPIPALNRREFVKTATLATAATALGGVLGAADTRQLPRKEKVIGVQVGAVSFLDEGTDHVLDLLQSQGAVNTLFIAAFSYGRGIAGRVLPGQAFPDHGRQEYDANFHGGNFAIPHARFYERTSVKQVRAPDHGDYDVLADVIPKARKRGLKVFAWYEDNFRDDLPEIAALKEVDWQGQSAAMLCPLHPDYRGFVSGLTEDYCQSYEIDGVMWGSERQGPLHNAFSARPGRSGDSAHVTCFCEFHQKAARERGINIERAKAGFRNLDHYVQTARAGQRPKDGYFVEFWRLLLEYPELLAWESLWTHSKHAIYTDVYEAAKRSRPEIKVGFHIWHLNSFSPFFRAEQDYAAFARQADFLKIVVYNNCGGARYVGYLDRVASTVFQDLPKEQLLALYNAWLGYPGEAALDQLASTGLSSDYVARETGRALAGVAGTACQIFPGLDVDIPAETGGEAKRTVPEDVYRSTTAALRAGANGVVFSRKYSEMRLANLKAGGQAVRDYLATV